MSRPHGLVAITFLSFGWGVALLSTDRLRKGYSIASAIVTAVILYLAWAATHIVAL